VTTSRNDGLLVNTAGKRRFSRGAGLCRELEASSEDSSVPFGRSNNGPVDNTTDYGWDKKLSPSRLRRSTTVNGATAVNRVEISAQVRKAMRSVPQPVSIITSTDISTGRPVFRGATISSFNTVTIEPTTIVSLNIKRPSSTFDAIESSGYFLVHLLKADKTTSELANAFTKGGSADPFRQLKEVSQAKLPQVSGQAAMVSSGPPLIEGYSSPSCLLCRYLPRKTVQLGDHVVVFGTVDRVTQKLKKLEESSITCLAYANGQYGCVSPLELSSEPKISSAAFEEFVSKIRLMDHSCLRTVMLSTAYLDPPDPGLKASLRIFSVRSRELFDFLTRDDTLNSKSRSLSIRSETRPMPSLSNGILKAVTFYSIFLPSVHGTDFTTFGVPHLPPKASKALQEYQIVGVETHNELLSIRATLQRLHGPQSAYQPPVSDIYSLERSLSEHLGENLRYLDRYIRCCLTPLNLPEPITAASPVLQRLVTQYNATLRALRWMYYQTMDNCAYRTDDAFATQSNRARAQARAAVMSVHQKDILLSWIEWPAKMPERLQNIFEDFQGLGDELMSWLRQYGEICEKTAAHLNSYKAFLRTSELEFSDCNRDGVGPSCAKRLSRRASNAVPRKRFGRRSIGSKIYTTKMPLVRVYTTERPLVRGHLTDTPLIRRHWRNIARRIPGPLVARKAAVGPSPNYPAEDERKIKFKDPYTRLIDLAERREEFIQNGLEDIKRLVADEFHDESKSLRPDAVNRRRQSEMVIAEDRKQSKTQAKQPGPAGASAEQFFEIMSK
jgi:flavin reductase (DIM6/NTAB) family NADH-FMN oxidoreductase RutF